jgi:hypothetical protein
MSEPSSQMLQAWRHANLVQEHIIRRQHFAEKSENFMGYTVIPLKFMLRSLTFKVLTEADEYDQFATELEASDAIDVDGFLAELDAWSQS